MGHTDDVDLAKFIPSSNYLVTGSSDSSIMSWDVIDGSSLKILTCYKGRIKSMAFPVDGKFLVSVASDHKLSIMSGHDLSELKIDTDAMSTMAFSRCGAMLASGSLDGHDYVWDLSRLFDEIDTDDLSVCSAPQC